MFLARVALKTACQAPVQNTLNSEELDKNKRVKANVIIVIIVRWESMYARMIRLTILARADTLL